MRSICSKSKIPTGPEPCFFTEHQRSKVAPANESKSPDAPAEFESLIEELKKYCGSDFYGIEPATLEEVIIEKLKSKNQTVALAESCTGGLIAHRLTQVTGSSQVLRGSLVAYQTEIKFERTRNRRTFISEHGVVSKAVAIAMAESIRKKWNADFGLATTGYLGPSGGDAKSPVGTVWMAVATATETRALEFHFENHRERAKERAAQYALDLLRKI